MSTPSRDAANVLVFAGTMQQAKFYARELGLAPGWQYLTPNSARGRNEPTVYCVGTYYERRDFQEAMSALIPARPTFLGEAGTEIVP